MKYFKVGQTVYSSNNGEGTVISYISDRYRKVDYPIEVEFLNGISSSFTEDGRETLEDQITLSQTPIPPIVNKPLTEEYVPFTFENMLIGTIVKSKKNGAYLIITYQCEAGVWVANKITTYNELFNEYTYLEGSPCGKLA